MLLAFGKSLFPAPASRKVADIIQALGGLLSLCNTSPAQAGAYLQQGRAIAISFVRFQLIWRLFTYIQYVPVRSIKNKQNRIMIQRLTKKIKS